MKKAVIYCFSGSGNTARLVELYRKTFEEKGIDTKVYSVTEKYEGIGDAAECDVIGFAFPVHGFNAPSIMLDLARKMPKGDKEYFTLSCGGEALLLNNSAAWKLNGILKRKGYALKAEHHYAMPYNMIFRHSDRFAQRLWDTAKAICPIDAAEIADGKAYKMKKVPFAAVIASVIRIEQPAMRVNGRFFSVDKDKCVGCLKCVRNCPTDNIKYEDGKFSFGGDCICCTRCSFNCPSDAINIAMLNGWRVNGAYPLDKGGDRDSGKHKKYCARSYEKYFREADEKISRNGL